ncbi:lysozyme inhibitor LprI family protein [Wenxinia saemankumensis]|uniref:Uncharacterized conserved protein YecT, DUF1311 family n=1 Tax=Wenxinia saemankumensis TaxID=1447782 RepID=A0A1M6ANM9_9RHOB|nr:lysozyme inhibitor LprI family protein [Wenxinia saemankumensis]SHI38065.1 Uncharacterized conserved protein YecT, DUF1311 family [Wenxinia saemankumensis]
MRAFSLSIALAALPFAAPAAAQDVDCARDQTQMALNICAQRDWQAADDELNRLWAILKPRADAGGWGQRLLEEQRTWLRARDAQCEGERDRYAGGSMAPLVYWTCMEQTTLRRNDDLRRMM